MKNEEVLKIIENSFNEKKNSHAFLMSTNNINKCFNDLIDLIKKINCNNNGNDNCNICITIEKNTNPDLIIVEPDGKEIKKDSIIEIITRFKTKPLINKYSIYIIKEADKMNLISSNKLLKFLEEPYNNVLGFFITNNINNIISTIKSRCEIFNLKYGNDSILDYLNIEEKDMDNIYPLTIEFLNILNSKNKFNIYVYSKKISIYEKNDIIKIFELLKTIYVYKFDNVSNNNNIKILEKIIEIISENNISILTKRINLISKTIKFLNNNCNKDLTISNFILEWE